MFPIFKPTLNSMLKCILGKNMYQYPYSEGSDNVRTALLNYIEQEGFLNTQPYDYEDIDAKGLSINNLTLTVSTSHAFELVLDVIARPYDVVIMTGPNYGLFSFKPERINVDVEIIDLEKEDNYLINPDKLNKFIKTINNRLKNKYPSLDYTPKVIAYVNGNPCNPTGKVMGNKQLNILKNLVDVCVSNDVFIIDDLIYRDITYDASNIAIPLATIPGAFKNTISLFGLSKSYGLASLRAGFVVADEVIIREIINRVFQQIDAVPLIN
ncbi:MAG: aminotransferase class I/II-fold pyridoxal phosphate-dependent enzyme, partial [Bacilli bacterium]